MGCGPNKVQLGLPVVLGGPLDQLKTWNKSGIRPCLEKWYGEKSEIGKEARKLSPAAPEEGKKPCLYCKKCREVKKGED